MTAASFNETVAAEVRAEMARQRLTQLEVALALGWDQRYLSRRMTGVVAWSTDDLEQIAQKLGVPIHALTSPRALSA